MNPINDQSHGLGVDILSWAQQSIDQGDRYYAKHLDIRQPFNTLDLALDEYYKALEILPDNPEVLGKMARVFLRQGKLKRAMAMANKALTFDPKAAEALYVKGYVLYKDGCYQESLSYLDQAVKHSPKPSARYRFSKFYSHWALGKQAANGFQKLGQFALGLMEASVALMISPFDEEPMQLSLLLKVMPKLLWGCCLEEQGKLEEATQLYMALYEKYLGLSAVMGLLGGVYQRREMPEEALEWLNRSVVRDPLSDSHYYQMGLIYEEQGDYVSATECIERLLAVKPADPEIHCSMANLYAVQGDYDKAIAHYKAALKHSRDKHWASLVAQTLGSLYADVQKNHEAAQMAFELAIELHPEDVNNYIHLGIVHFETGDFDNAEIVYQQALAHCLPHHKVYSNLGYLKWMKGEIGEAIEYYQRAIEMAPDYCIPYNNLGVIYLDILGDIDQAVELIDRASELNEAYALAHYNLGRAYTLQGRKLEAAECFHKAQRLNQFTRDLDNEELSERINSLFNSPENG